MKKLLGLPIAINLPKYTQILMNLGFISAIISENFRFFR